MDTLVNGAHVWWYDPDGLWSREVSARVRRGFVVCRIGKHGVVVRPVADDTMTIRMSVVNVYNGWVGR